MLGTMLGLSLGVLLAILVATYALHWVVPSYGMLVVLLAGAISLVVAIVCVVVMALRTRKQPVSWQIPVIAGMLVGFACVLARPAYVAITRPLDTKRTDILTVTTSDNGFVRASTHITVVRGDGQATSYEIGSELLSPYAWAYEPYSYGDLERMFVQPHALGRMTYAMSVDDGELKLDAQYGVDYDEQGDTVPSVVLDIVRAYARRHGSISSIDVTHLYGGTYAVAAQDDGCYLVDVAGGTNPEFVPVQAPLGHGILFDGWIRRDLADIPLTDEGEDVTMPVSMDDILQ